MNLPLEGIRIVTLTVAWAGPFAEMLLADWGAEVIRVESIQRLPPTTRGRQARPSKESAKLAPVQFTYVDDEPGERPWNRCAMFNYAGRNKFGCTMDLMKPRGKDLFKQLIAKSDVVIENNGGGAVDKLGLGYPVLKEVNPKLIMISLPAYGNFGPYRSFGGFGVHQEATSGHLWLLGYPDLGPETNPATFHPDACAGTHAALAVLLALRHRRRTGKGQFIDLAQAETSLSHQAEAVLDYTLNRRVRTKTGNRHTSAAPCGVYPCQGEDEWVAITIFGDVDWSGLCRAIGNPAWANDTKFSTSLNRWKNQDELDAFISAWTRRHSNYEIMYSLQKEGVAAGPVISNKDAFDDPQLLDRKQFEAVYQAECGTHLTPSFLWRAKNTPNKIRRPAVRMGEHNEYVYKELIGVTEEEYDQLVKDGHIGMDFAPHVR